MQLGISSSIFVALAASLLTAMPLTPAGIGFVQAGIVGVARRCTACPVEAGTAVALTDFVLASLSVIVIGGMLYAFSPMVRRAHGASVPTGVLRPRSAEHGWTPDRIGTFVPLRRLRRRCDPAVARTHHRPSIWTVGSSARTRRMTLQPPRSFNSWLRGQLKEKKMSQRQLALQSGVDHSTISRLIKGDRMPSLGTATKLARGLREIRDESDGPSYFASLLEPRRCCPTARVEYALRGDDVLTEADVRELMQTYVALRDRSASARRTATGTPRPTPATGSAAAPDRTLAPRA